MTNAARLAPRACFGHVSQPGEPVLTDALSAMLADAPANYLDQWHYGLRQRGAEVAEGLIARAILRIFVLRTYFAERHMQPLAACDRDACQAAHLLIAADLVAALLADDSKETFARVKDAIGLVLPDVRERAGSVDLHIAADRAKALGLHDLAEGMTDSDLQQIARWSRARRTSAPARDHVIGLFSDIAIVHDALFSNVDGREFKLPETGLGVRARHACVIAVAFSVELADREPDPRGILMPCED
ncbi:hypothetical protein J2X48_002879 [Bosea sp. BE271]|jgi:hypothetical protein|uniref:hypothetical protein n=1 Tax=Bosea TaxID=85413 RepID=UPI002740E54A|nr:MULTISPECIES: hypothetical protein [Bosea]MDR6828965.1 hypothetical protein [Bosea robiniae]MDR6895621.1 hypothetical protein [Bosea sp. BE109]MDR7139016.1 hypothetical protein [Bosea sp. BE168]MDR7175945.1 hypothetical protein [Bosea sp. BE271]